MKLFLEKDGIKFYRFCTVIKNINYTKQDANEDGIIKIYENEIQLYIQSNDEPSFIVINYNQLFPSIKEKLSLCSMRVVGGFTGNDLLGYLYNYAACNPKRFKIQVTYHSLSKNNEYIHAGPTPEFYEKVYLLFKNNPEFLEEVKSKLLEGFDVKKDNYYLQSQASTSITTFQNITKAGALEAVEKGFKPFAVFPYSYRSVGTKGELIKKLVSDFNYPTKNDGLPQVNHLMTLMYKPKSDKQFRELLVRNIEFMQRQLEALHGKVEPKSENKDSGVVEEVVNNGYRKALKTTQTITKNEKYRVIPVNNSNKVKVVNNYGYIVTMNASNFELPF